MQCIHDLRPESINSYEILESKCALILLRTTLGSIFVVLFYGSITCALSVAASIMYDRAYLKPLKHYATTGEISVELFRE